MQNINQKTISSIAHLGAFSKYFIPFGNFLIPITIWVIHKDKAFISSHAKRALNFQISLFLYAAILIAIAISGLVVLGINLGNIGEFYFTTSNELVINNQSVVFTSPYILFAAALIILGLAIFFLELLSVINAAVRAGEGKTYKYPLTIDFIKLNEEELENFHEEITEPSI